MCSTCATKSEFCSPIYVCKEDILIFKNICFWQCMILCPVCKVLHAPFFFIKMNVHFTVIFLIQSTGKKIIWTAHVSIVISQLYLVISIFIYQSNIVFFVAGMASFCFRNIIDLAVENAFILCSANNTCIAECYRGYIFPSGITKESYSCRNENWTPLLSTCKRKFIKC